MLGLLASFPTAHYSSLLLYRQHPPGLPLPPLTCPSMYLSTRMTQRSLTSENAVMCLLSLEPGGNRTTGTYVLTSLIFLRWKLTELHKSFNFYLARTDSVYKYCMDYN